MNVETGSIEETNRVAAEFLTTVVSSDERASVVALKGELGAGKTAFTKGLAETLGITEAVTSPTFVLMKRYQVPTSAEQRFDELVHIDAYRLESADELQTLQFEKCIAQPRTLVVLEWPERVEGALPDDVRTVVLEALGEGKHRISY